MIIIVQRNKQDGVVAQEVVDPTKPIMAAGPAQSGREGTGSRFGGIWLFTEGGKSVELQYDAEGLVDLIGAITEGIELFKRRQR